MRSDHTQADTFWRDADLRGQAMAFVVFWLAAILTGIGLKVVWSAMNLVWLAALALLVGTIVTAIFAFVGLSRRAARAAQVTGEARAAEQAETKRRADAIRRETRKHGKANR